MVSFVYRYGRGLRLYVGNFIRPVADMAAAAALVIQKQTNTPAAARRSALV